MYICICMYVGTYVIYLTYCYLHVYVIDDSRVNDDVVFEIFVYRQTTIDHFTLGDSHVIIMHFIKIHLTVNVEGMRCLAKHQLHLW